MSIALIAGIAVILLIIAIALKQRSGGPRITTIERRVEKEDEQP